jgi:hypothetical protein
MSVHNINNDTGNKGMAEQQYNKQHTVNPENIVNIYDKQLLIYLK